MGVHIDKAGGYDLAARVDRLRGFGLIQPLDSRNAIVNDADVRRIARASLPVDDEAVADDEIEHQAPLLLVV
jgi:hypothetical protein